jgi:hypothetical protein
MFSASSMRRNVRWLLRPTGLIADSQTLLDQFKADLNLTQGEVTMFIPDMPNVPPQDVPVLIAQSNISQQGATVTERKIGFCQPIGNMSGVAANLTNTISPKIDAQIYFDLYEHQKVDGAATVTVLQNPKHGIFRLITEADRGSIFSSNSGPLDPANPGYIYLPEQGYLGNDSVTLLVDIGGKTVKEVHYFKVVGHPVNNDGDSEICKKGPFWKITSTLDANGTSSVGRNNYCAGCFPLHPCGAMPVGYCALPDWVYFGLTLSDDCG